MNTTILFSVSAPVSKSGSEETCVKVCHAGENVAPWDTFRYFVPGTLHEANPGDPGWLGLVAQSVEISGL